MNDEKPNDADKSDAGFYFLFFLTMAESFSEF